MPFVFAYADCWFSDAAAHLALHLLQVNSVWFKLYIYYLTGCGPPSLLLVKGTKLRKLPKVLLVGKIVYLKKELMFDKLA